MFTLPSRSYGQPSGWPSSKPLSAEQRPARLSERDQCADSMTDHDHTLRDGFMKGAA